MFQQEIALACSPVRWLSLLLHLPRKITCNPVRWQVNLFWVGFIIFQQLTNKEKILSLMSYHAILTCNAKLTFPADKWVFYISQQYWMFFSELYNHGPNSERFIPGIVHWAHPPPFNCLFVSFFLTEWGNKVSSGAPDVSAGSSPLSGGVSPVLWQRVSPTAAYTPLHCNNLHSTTLQPTLRQPSLRPPALRTGSCPLEPA